MLRGSAIRTSSGCGSYRSKPLPETLTGDRIHHAVRGIAKFEVQMWRRRTAGTADDTKDVSCRHLLPEADSTAFFGNGRVCGFANAE
jgi:hypothetical protein